MTLTLTNPFSWVLVPAGLLGRALHAGLRLIKPKSRTGRAIYYAIWAWIWFPGTNTATLLYLASKAGYEAQVSWLLGKIVGAFWWCVDTAEFWYHFIPKIVKAIEAVSKYMP